MRLDALNTRKPLAVPSPRRVSPRGKPLGIPLFVCALLAILGAAFGIDFDGHAYAQDIKFRSHNHHHTSLSFTASDLRWDTLSSPNGSFLRPSFVNGNRLEVPGRPQLPCLTALVEIPLCDSFAISVTPGESRSSILPLPIYPAQQPRHKSDTAAPSTIPFAFDSEFYSNTFNADDAQPLVQLIPLGIARNRRLARLVVTPFQYTPANGTLLSFSSLDIDISYIGADSAATEQMFQRHYSALFEPGKMTDLPHRDISTMGKTPVKMLIVTPPAFVDDLKPFIDWKQRSGIATELALTSDREVGATARSIRSFLTNRYDSATTENPAPTYVILVGDVAQIPAFGKMCSRDIGNDHVTDLYFACWSEGDNLPDCYLGRLSAQNSAHLQSIIEKTLYYEQYRFDDPSYLGKGILVAGTDQAQPTDDAHIYSDPAMDYVAKYYINSSHGFRKTIFYRNDKTFSPHGVTVTGSSMSPSASAELKKYYAEGFGWINYSAHGLKTGWVEPKFLTNDLDGMTNYRRPSVMIGNCCLTAAFNNPECFAEALVRKSQFAGAVAYIGATDYTFWPLDFYWTVGYRPECSNRMDATFQSNYQGAYDQLFHTHDQDFSSWHTSLGSMLMAGNLSVCDYSNQNYVDYNWEIYTLLGDPSLTPFLGTAQPMALSAPANIIRGNNHISISAAPHAYVALSHGENHEIIAAAFANGNGNVSFDIPATVSDEHIEVVATAQGYIPAIDTITLLQPSNPFLAVANVRYSSRTAGDTITLSFDVVNTSQRNFPTIGYALSGNPSQITPLHEMAYIPSLWAGDHLTQHAVCRSLLAPDLADNDTITLFLQLLCDSLHFNIIDTLRLVVNAPHLTVDDAYFQVDNTADSLRLHIVIGNHGSAPSQSASLAISLPQNLFQLPTTAATIRPLPVGTYDTLHFNSPFLPAARATRSIPFDLSIAYFASSHSASFSGLLPNEDFESASLSSFPWLTSDNHPWSCVASNALHGRYAAKSHTPIPCDEQSLLSLSLQNSRDDSISFLAKLENSEAGDTLFFLLDNTRFPVRSDHDTLAARFSFAVPQGEHSFSFLFQRGNETPYNQLSCALIDDIVLPLGNTRIHRFSADSICQHAPYHWRGHEYFDTLPGTYHYTDSLADTIYHLALYVLEPPTVAITTFDTLVVAGQQFTLYATGADSYRWNSGEETSSLTTQLTADSLFSVIGFRKGCSASASITIHTQPMAISGIEQWQLRAFPNPAHELLTIEAPIGLPLSLLNWQGATVWHTPHTTAPSTTLLTQPLPAGIYFLRCNEKTLKIIIQK